MHNIINIPIRLWSKSSFRNYLKPTIRCLTTTWVSNKYIDEPEYLKYTVPQVPVYDLLNIQIKCYDFTILEHYSKYVHRTALHMDFDITNAWATPHQSWKVTNNESGTSKVTHEYQLNKYERNIQISNLPAYSAPLFFEVIRSSLPAGVSVSIHEHKEQFDEIRYIPDFELLALKSQLTELTVEESK